MSILPAVFLLQEALSDPEERLLMAREAAEPALQAFTGGHADAAYLLVLLIVGAISFILEVLVEAFVEAAV